MLIITREKKDYVPTYRYSSLSCYKDCPTHYKHLYVEGGTGDRTYSTSTLKGTLSHNQLEKFYRGDIKEVLESFFLEVFNLFSEHGLPYSPLLEELVRQMAELYKRSSSDYTGKDAIRTASGSVASKPQMTTAWKKAVEGLSYIPEALSVLYSDATADIPDVVSEAYSLLSDYSYPDVGEVVGVEIPLSKFIDGELVNGVALPEEYGGIYLEGMIDLVTRRKDGLWIIDHKTSIQEYTPMSVGHNGQLNLYAYAIEQLLGEPVVGVAINSLRQRKLIESPLLSREEIFQNTLAPHWGIVHEHFKKHVPDSPYSKCLSWYGGRCPYLSQCWPSYASD